MLTRFGPDTSVSVSGWGRLPQSRATHTFSGHFPPPSYRSPTVLF